MAHSYFIVMINFERRIDGNGVLRPAAQEAIVDPELTRADILSRIKSGEYRDIAFIHEIKNWLCSDVTHDDDFVEAVLQAQLEDT